jgi:hypothetical protein
MTIYMSKRKQEVRAENQPLQSIEFATRNLQRVAPLSRINHIRVELGIFEQGIKRVTMYPQCLFADIESHMKHTDTITLNLNPKDKGGVF